MRNVLRRLRMDLVDIWSDKENALEITLLSFLAFYIVVLFVMLLNELFSIVINNPVLTAVAILSLSYMWWKITQPPRPKG